ILYIEHKFLILYNIALNILEYKITQSASPVFAATITKELKLARSTTYNILQALSAKGVLHKVPIITIDRAWGD
ncbi:hypothetical protein C0122_09070, partial [Moraxella catarrhalis]|uniref:hypothetical protein n=2 Tax=Moraxella catarrhalis TaxID=480 RepID=UPI0012CEF32D